MAAATDQRDHDYPEHRVADVVLTDGSTARIRPIRESDGPAILDLHSRMSERTRYLRYFTAYPRISDRDLAHFTIVDHHDREALVASLGGQFIAVGRYERIDTESAEVAFVVADAHQGRGISSVLLEHLAQAAREEGISRFEAEVLPENRQMARVFSQAGYSVKREIAHEVLHLTFAIAPTPRSLEVLRDREQATEATSIARLLSPRSVAVIGAGRAVDSIGRAVLVNLREGGFTGDLHAIHPTEPEVAGVPAVPSVLDLAGPLDLAVVAVPAKEVPQVVRDCVGKSVRGIVIVSSGFAETGPDGQRAEREIVRLARSGGARVVGPNALGILSTDPAVRLNATLAPRVPAPGRVGFFSQSGALGIALLDQARSLGIGLSSFVSAGNRSDVSGNDLLQFWQSDPATDVVLLYLETFGNARKFARVARRVARSKPVVVLKSRGRSSGLAGTGAGPAGGGLEALFEASGVIRVDRLDELFDVAQLAAHQPLPAGRRVAIVGNSSALGILAAEACQAAGLQVATGYPADLGPSATPREFSAALGAAVADPRADAVLIVFSPVSGVAGTGYAEAIRAAGESSPVPVLSSFLAATGIPELLRSGASPGSPGRGSVPSYRSVEAAVRALARIARYAEWRREPPGELPQLSADRDVAAALAERALGESDQVTEAATADVHAILGAYGISVWPESLCAGEAEAVAAAESYGYPVVVKAAEGLLRHRVDLGGVRLGLGSARAVAAAVRDIAHLQGPGGRGVLVQPMAPPGVACVVEVTQDSAFGAVVGFGLAGVATDLLGDWAWRAAPLTDRDAHELVRAPLAAPLLFGHRGAQPADAARLEDLVLRAGALADEIPQIHGLSLNPVLATATGLTVLHASIRLAPPAPRPDAGARRL
jgi:acyl-CoA synthetase (NDP forming)/RimJ/RimL family protein N-acetyltransferase